MILSERVARVYAEALFEIGKANDNLPAIAEGIEAVAGLYGSDPQFRAFYSSPRLDPERKEEAVKAALGDKVDRAVLGLLCVLVEKGREAVLPSLAELFLRFREEHEGVIHAHVKSARPLHEEERSALLERLNKQTGKKVLLHEEVAPQLLGGLVIRVGDQVLDGSLKRRLDGLRQELLGARG